MKTGLANIQIGANNDGTGPTVTIRCGSGASSDRYREVEYSLFGSYREFTAEISAEGIPRSELQTQLEVFADGVRAANKVLTGGESAPLSAPVTGKETMRLRLTCEDRNAQLVLRNGRVRS